MKNRQPKTMPFGKLYTSTLPSLRTGVFYNTFAYPTKISPETVAVYIAAHTKPGDTVLDVFGGSGSTGLAALMCEHPTDAMIKSAHDLNLHPLWGARNAIIYELGIYGAYASKVMANPPDENEFSKAAKQLLCDAKQEVGAIYSTTDSEGIGGTIRHIIYSDMVSCPKCQFEFPYYEGMVQRAPLVIDGNGVCPSCGHKDKSVSFPYTTESVYDSLLCELITRRKRIPVRIYGQTGSKKWVRDATPNDLALFETYEAESYPSNCNAKKIEWGELYRAGYHTGITHLHHFYTKRNFRVMYCLWEKTNAYAAVLRDALRLLLLSYNASHATLMTRVVVKKNSKDFVLTGAQSGVLYISSLPVEKNIFAGIKRKQVNFEEAFSCLRKCSGRIVVSNSSSQQLELRDKSVDYIFTDPPFGDFIPYAEVNQINELWLGEPTNRNYEIIISSSQHKTVSEYQTMMTDVFSEMKRVLKDKANATVVFHASKAAIWNALCSAYSDAGFAVSATNSLDKSQVSFKQVVSEGSVQGDPIILLVKGNSSVSSKCSQTVLDEVIAEDALELTWNERKIYANYIGKCLKHGISVEFDAKTAYNYITQKAEAVT